MTIRKNTTSAFTFIELLLYVAIVSILASVTVIFMTNITSARIKVKVQEQTVYSARFLSERIAREIRAASAITSLSANDLCLVMVDAARNPTRIYLSAGRAKIAWGGGGSCAVATNNFDLTGPDINVTGLNFADFSSGLSKNIKYSLAVSGKTVSNRQEWVFDTTVEGASEIRSN